ncbi:MAG: DUF2567 domain-containing protein [Actinomycetes bacterium]
MSGAVGGAAPSSSAGGTSRRVTVVTLATCLVLAVLLGLAWWALAPRGDVVPQQGYLFAVDDPELLAGQDSVFALLSALAGVLLGGWVGLRPSAEPVARVCAAVLGSGVGAFVAWQVGRFLGPPGVSARPRASPHAVPAPLDLHALGALVVWPAFTAGAAFVVLLGASLLGFRRSEPG